MYVHIILTQNSTDINESFSIQSDNYMLNIKLSQLWVPSVCIKNSGLN